MAKSKTEFTNKRKLRNRKSIKKNVERLRLSVDRSNKHIYAQIIDDQKHVTVVGFGDYKIKTGTKTERAQKVGEEIAKLAKKNDITQVMFDRGANKYHGRIKAVADGAREAGLDF